MNRSLLLFFLLAFGVAFSSGTPALRAQFGNSPEAVAAREKQAAIEEATPKLQITEEMLPLDDSRPHHR